MKNISFWPAFFLCLLSICSCKDVIFLPVKGSIGGYISDNNGAPLAGIQVSATYNAPSQSAGQPPLPNTILVSTDNNGYYRLSDLWDEVVLNVNQPGFLPISTRIDLDEDNEPQQNFMLDGSPTIGAVSLSKTTLSAETPDTVIVRMEVQDVFNSISQGYVGNFFLKSGNGATTTIIPAALWSQSLVKYLFEAKVLSTDLPVGTYGLQAEVQDPDGNMHQTDTGKSLQVK